jgi:hypothetical protein
MRTANVSDSTAPRRRYRDVPLFVVLIPLINAVNYYLTYPSINFSRYTLFTYIIDTLTGYLAWLGIRLIIIHLDKKYPYGYEPLRRVLLQLLITTVCGLLIIILETESINWMLADHPVPTSFYLFDIFIFAIWIFVINGIYIGLHYYGEWSDSELLRKKEKEIRKEGFMVNHGKQNLSIPFDDISCLYVDGEYVVLLSTTSKKYYISQSLDNCEELLPAEWFFRLNRQFIFQRKAIRGYTRVENGKLDVLTNHFPNIPETIQVSRIKAAAFRNWFRDE